MLGSSVREEASKLAQELPWDGLVHVSEYGLTHLEQYGLTEKYGQVDGEKVGVALVSECQVLAREDGERWVHELARFIRLLDGQLFGLGAEVASSDDTVDWSIPGKTFSASLTVSWKGAQARLRHHIALRALEVGRTEALATARQLEKVAHAVDFAVRAWERTGLYGQAMTRGAFARALRQASSGAELPR